MTVCHDDARKAAQDAEATLSSGEGEGAIAGIPYSVKDLVPTKGVRTTFGSAVFGDNVPNHDSVAAERLMGAGGILLGKTTTPALGHKAVTTSLVSGVSRNPWNLERTCGGSSGGAAAAVASGQGPLALGTDGGGSVRIPASACGIVGLKPTLGRIPQEVGAGPFRDLELYRPDDPNRRGRSTDAFRDGGSPRFGPLVPGTAHPSRPVVPGGTVLAREPQSGMVSPPGKFRNR